MRADAARNRERIVDAASTLFQHAGTEVSLNEIAAEAGVGIATLLRRFSTKAELIDAVFDRDLNNWLTVIDEAATANHPGRAFLSLTRAVVDHQMANPRCADLVIHSLFRSPAFADRLALVRRQISELIDRGIAAGTLSPSTCWHDFELLIESAAALCLIEPEPQQKVKRLTDIFHRSLTSAVDSIE